MTVREFKRLLGDYPNRNIVFVLPLKNEINGPRLIPEHFHISEIGRKNKVFVDCGGIRRSEVTCVMQFWCADDIDHRMTTDKLAKIMEKAVSFLDLSSFIEIEYQQESLTTYLLSDYQVKGCAVYFMLSTKYTDCLSPDTCGVNQSKCCETTCC